MGLLDFCKSIMGRGNQPSGKTSRACVVDAGALAGTGSNVPPRLKIQALQRLARYAEEESVKVVAVLDGEELRAVSHGASFQGVDVLYAERSASLAEALLEASRRHPDAVVVTDDKEVDAQVRGRGGSSMRISTFRKAIEGSVDADGEEDGGSRDGERRDRRPQGRSRRGGRRDRRGGDRGDPVEREDRRSRNDQGESRDRGEEGRSRDEGSASRNPVSDLIDLVE